MLISCVKLDMRCIQLTTVCLNRTYDKLFVWPVKMSDRTLIYMYTMVPNAQTLMVMYINIAQEIGIPILPGTVQLCTVYPEQYTQAIFDPPQNVTWVCFH